MPFYLRKSISAAPFASIFQKAALVFLSTQKDFDSGLGLRAIMFMLAATASTTAPRLAERELNNKPMISTARCLPLG